MGGFLCGPRLYEFEGWTFEIHYWCGPWPLRKDGELFKRAGKKFFNMYKRFSLLSEEEQNSYRTGGGCIKF